MVSQSETAASVIAKASQSNPRLIPGRESFSAEKRIGKHFKTERQVEAPVSSTPLAMLPSELEHAKAAVWWKAFLKASRVQGVPNYREIELSLLDDILSRDTWVEFDDAQKAYVRHAGHPRLRDFGGGDVLTKASLLSDTLSGGEYLVPEWFDDMLIHTPLLYGELTPYVTIRTMPYGDTYMTGAVGNPTMANVTEGAAANVFDATSLVTEFTGPIKDVGCYVTIGKNLLQDIPIVDLGRDLMQALSMRYMEWVDEQIAIGDGTTEPMGIFTAAGVSTQSSSNGTGGPFAVSDLERLIRGVSLAYRRRAGNSCRYVTSDYMYWQVRGIAVGTSDARRIFGMSHEDYTVLNRGVSIVETIPTGSIAFAGLSGYRLYKRPGPVLAIEDRGQTLTVSNLTMVLLRGRLGGEPELPGYICKMTDAPTSYGN